MTDEERQIDHDENGDREFDWWNELNLSKGNEE